MAQIALSAIGAGVGAFFGSPALGWTLGSLAGNILFGPDGAKKQQGPRLDDLTVQSSAQGQPIPLIYGSMRLAGHLIWSTDIEEHKHDEDVGGKGGGGAEVTTYTYTANFAVAFCEGPIALFRKIWADGKLIYDISNSASTEMAIINYKGADDIRSYLGTQTQEPDALIQSVEGVANTPAYRGTAYLVFEDMKLADFGNRIPNITAEVVSSATPTYVGPVLNSRPGTWQAFVYQVDHGVIDYWGDKDSGQAESTYNFETGRVNTQPVIRRYSLEGDFIEQIPLTYTYVGDAIFQNFIDLTQITGVVRGLPNVAAGWIQEITPSNSQYMIWYYNQQSVGGPLLRLNGSRMDARLQRMTYYDGYIYVRPGGDGAPENSVIRYPATDGYPSHQADAEYTTAYTNVCDFFINSSGVWVLAKTDFAHHIIALDHDLTLQDAPNSWTVPAVSLGGLIVCESGASAVIGNQGGAEWYVLRLNADGTSTTLASGSAPGAGTVMPPIQHAGGAILQIRNQFISCGLYADAGVTWASIYRDVVLSRAAKRLGWTDADIDVSDLEDDLCKGFQVSRPQTAREILSTSQPHLFVDIVESDWKLKFLQRGRDSSRTIVEDDLAAHLYGSERPEELQRRRKQDLELPRQVNIQYIDRDRDYQSGEQYARRLTTDSVGVDFVSMPIVLTPDEARQNADGLLYDAWIGRDDYQADVSLEYLGVDPADVVTVTHEGATHLVRVTDSTLQFPGILSLRGVSVRPPAFTTETLLIGSLHDTYESEAPGTEAPVEADPVSGLLPGPTTLELLDLPLLRDVDNNAGLYYAVRSYTDGWRGARIFRSADGAVYNEVDSFFTSAQIGRTSTTLASGSTTIVDNGSTVTILINGTLTSTTDAGLLNFTNMAAIGAHGRWEILSFKTATLNGDGTYTLSGFLRGLRGTDHNVGNHTSSDTVVILTSTTIDRFITEVSELDQTRFYKGVSIGATLQETEAEEIEVELQSLKPLSPVHVNGSRNTSTNDWTLTWIRRGRVQPLWIDYVDVPLGETTESYSIDILNGSAVVRTISASSQTATYTSAQQVTDFGSARTTFSGNLYQVSASVGRGTVRSFTV